jgi:hypothetical protein
MTEKCIYDVNSSMIIWNVTSTPNYRFSEPADLYTIIYKLIRISIESKVSVLDDRLEME